jgi:hypothetical protein
MHAEFSLTAHIFIRFMALMDCEMLAECEIVAAFIGHHCGVFCNVGLDDRDYIGSACPIDMERSGLAALAVNGRQHSVLVAVTATLDLDRVLLAADEGFIRFDDAANAAHGLDTNNTHYLADTVRHEPRSLESDGSWKVDC